MVDRITSMSSFALVTVTEAAGGTEQRSPSALSARSPDTM